MSRRPRRRTARHARRKSASALVAWIACSLLAFGAPAALAQSADPSANLVAKGVDVTMLRPLGMVRLVTGTALFVPVSFFNALGQSSLAAFGAMGISDGANWSIFSDSLELMVLEPSRYVFERPLGEDLAGG